MMSRAQIPNPKHRVSRHRNSPEHGSLSEQQLDHVFSALGDQTRRKLLARLSQGPAMVTELAVPFRMSLPAVSRHIRVLERARLVKRAVDGRVHRCSINAQPMLEATRWLQRYRHFWEGTLDSLAEYVEEVEKQKLR